MQVFERLENDLYTIIKTKVKKAMSSEYPDISFSNEPSDTDPSFPNVYITQKHREAGQDIEGSSINAVRVFIDITVSTNTSKIDASKVGWACTNALKSLRFDTSDGLPELEFKKQNNDRIYVCKVRGQRLIGSGDLL